MWRTAVFGAAACLGASAVAQTTLLGPPPLPPPAGAEGSTNIDGTVRQFTLSPTGQPDGIILGDGTEVHVPDQLSAALAAAVKPGDAVHIEGWRSPTPGVVAATSLTDARTGKAVVNTLPPAAAAVRPAAVAPPPGATEATVKGRVLQNLHGADGSIEGALLGDGLELRLPLPAPPPAVALLVPGQMVTARGYTLMTPYGQVMAVQAVGASPEALTPLAPAPAPGAAAEAPPVP